MHLIYYLFYFTCILCVFVRFWILIRLRRPYNLENLTSERNLENFPRPKIFWFSRQCFACTTEYFWVFRWNNSTRFTNTHIDHTAINRSRRLTRLSINSHKRKVGRPLRSVNTGIDFPIRQTSYATKWLRRMRLRLVIRWLWVWPPLGQQHSFRGDW